jgi:hypothetical protein
VRLYDDKLPPTEPTHGYWLGYPVGSEHLVPTGTWLGDITIAHLPWIFLYAADRWVYLAEPTAAGAWVFFPPSTGG